MSITDVIPLTAATMATRALTPRGHEELRLVHNRLGLFNHPIPTPRYRTSESDGKGTGLFALHDLPPGTEILTEPALFSIRNVGDNFTKVNTTHLESQAAQHPAFGGLFCPPNPEPTLERRFRVNSMAMTTPTGRSKKCTQDIFLEASRLNHSCIPNAHFTYNQNLNRITVYAIKTIKQDKEIFVTYDAEKAYETTQVRHEDLTINYSFKCDCKACDDSPFASTSKQRRQQMMDLKGKIKNREDNDSYSARAQQLIDLQSLRSLFEAEELVLFPEIADIYAWAASCYQAEVERGPSEAVF